MLEEMACLSYLALEGMACINADVVAGFLTLIKIIFTGRDR
jgi:hypothetical protein